MTPTLYPDTQTPVFPGNSAFQKATLYIHDKSLSALCFEGVGKRKEVITVTEGAIAMKGSFGRWSEGRKGNKNTMQATYVILKCMVVTWNSKKNTSNINFNNTFHLVQYI